MAHPADWLDSTRARSAHFLAEKTSEMICYLWYALPVNPYPSPHASPGVPSPALQLRVVPEFVAFVQKLLETTQVSQSVIVLSLHYIWRFKRLMAVVGPAGSEYRIAVVGLMMANKFLDDNTYTNKTWAEVSGIPLADVNHTEAEFLRGIAHNLYVDNATYVAWLQLLKGLVIAKENDRVRHAHRPRKPAHSARPRPLPLHDPRPRSSSPVMRSTLPPPPPPPPFTVPTHYTPDSYTHSPSPAPSSLKRSAAAAFSPTSAAATHVPTKRSELTLQIPRSATYPVPHPSPMDSLQDFANMDLNSTSNSLSTALGPVLHRFSTLVQPYHASLEDQQRNPVPKYLYFYSLTCSDAPCPPRDSTRDDRRKTRLRVYRPPQGTTTTTTAQSKSAALQVQIPTKSQSPLTPLTSTGTPPCVPAATILCKQSCVPPPISYWHSMPGAITATTSLATTTPVYGEQSDYDRVSVSAYTSPAISLNPHYPLPMPVSLPSGQRQQGQPPFYPYPTPQVPSTAHLSANEREELAFAKATAQVNAVNLKHVPPSSPLHDTSPGVPTMPFANAGPSGVCQMSYSSPGPHMVSGYGYGYGYDGGYGYGYGGPNNHVGYVGI